MGKVFFEEVAKSCHSSAKVPLIRVLQLECHIVMWTSTSSVKLNANYTYLKYNTTSLLKCEVWFHKKKKKCRECQISFVMYSPSPLQFSHLSAGKYILDINTDWVTPVSFLWKKRSERKGHFSCNVNFR